jgi:hypothetical protein
VIIAPTSRDRSAMIVFVDHTECCWLQALRRGFRHCFVALKHGPAWLVCDPLKSHMELTLLDLPDSFDLASHYAQQGHRVLVGRAGSPVPRPALALSPLTCVTVAKRLLAIRAAWVATPWQLFSHLLRAQPRIWRLVSAEATSRSQAFALDKSRK